MKPSLLLQGRALRSCLFFLAVALSLSATPSKAATWGTTDADFFSNFGFTEDWSVLELGSNPVTVSGSTVFGNVGVAGSTDLTIKNSSLDHLYLNSNANIDKSVTGSQIQQTTTTNLNPDSTAATNAANYFSGLPNSAANTWTSSNSSLSKDLDLGSKKANFTLSSASLTLTATSTTPVVFNLATLNLSSANLTLSGSANDEFVFNIYGGTMNISSSDLQLSGGLTAADVVFNYVGKSGSGPNISSSSFSGIVLSTQHSVTVSSSNIVGAVISNGVNISNSTESPDN